MSSRFKYFDRNTPLLLPPSLNDWIPEDHIVHFIIDAVDLVPVDKFKTNPTGSGSDQFHPHLMLSILIYCYATGRFSSREIECATYSDLAVRYIAADLHPDHDTICKFRRENGVAFKEAFIQVLELASELKVLKKLGGVSVDGTKIKANASKHSAVSYKKSGELLELLSAEVDALTQKAEQADSKPLEEGLSIPEEITRRETRIAKLKDARKIIEERHSEKMKAKQEEYEQKQKTRQTIRDKGGKPRGREPKPPQDIPDDKAQVNFTDEESRIMKTSSSGFQQCYNAQAAVDIEGSMLILGAYVTNDPNDKLQLDPALNSIDSSIREVSELLADSGYYSEGAVTKIESDETQNTEVYCDVERTPHGRTVADLEKRDDLEYSPQGLTPKEAMRQKLQTTRGRECYKLRKQTVEPAFGIIKEVLGFRQFFLRGIEKVNLEWDLLSIAYNLKRIFKLTKGNGLSPFDKKFFIGA
ncbi:probable transposase [Lentisphaera araneosa HTCC2155]|jgi:transposase|uniref:Probable transposase n=1 Tax=Lentisphaera araneosa HTCC2155 TaxID=313628 RepID=A6DIS4_9BACT|nr:IS1182 family transposase [Lentisphaera araneosa]EDM28360.1 probable transposase [Lentisphaera araneosa HTCC2155]